MSHVRKFCEIHYINVEWWHHYSTLRVISFYLHPQRVFIKVSIISRFTMLNNCHYSVDVFLWKYSIENRFTCRLLFFTDSFYSWQIVRYVDKEVNNLATIIRAGRFIYVLRWEINITVSANRLLLAALSLRYFVSFIIFSLSSE